MKYILIQNDDIKSKYLSKVQEKKDIKIIPMPGSAILIPFHIIKSFIRYGKPYSCIYRYLNDYKSFIKTIIRLFSEIIGITLCRIFRINIIWICHNIDKESVVHYRLLSKIRRMFFSKFSKKILVTDKKLVKYAKKEFPFRAKDILPISFGEILQNPINVDTIRFVEKVKNYVKNEINICTKNEIFFGLCCGSVGKKMAHFEKIPILLEKAECTNYSIRMIVVSPLSGYYVNHDRHLIKYLKTNHKVLFINQRILIPEVEIANYIDFIWRVNQDISMPFTIYHAASLRKPIISQDPGFTAEAVRYYSLGEVLSQDYSNIEEVLEKIQKWDPLNAENFLLSHNWDFAAKQIIKYCC